jgi:ABC-type branched-subunit amino acid transport system ATPase component/branched-subunit amino acid ABC-type transport system permease component
MILPFVIAGLVTGSVYGLAGVGLILTYKTTGIFNFAYGAVASVAAYVFYELNVIHHIPWVWAALVSVLGVGVILGLLFAPLARALAGASLAAQVTATVGVFLIVEGGTILLYGTTVTRSVPQFLPTGAHSVFGATVTDDQIISVVIAVIATVLLWGAMRFTRLGTSMRAVVDNPELLSTAGTSPLRVRRVAWLVGTTFAALCGLLLAPRQPDLTGDGLTFLVLQAFGAAAVGAFTSLPLTFLGGLGLGIGSALCSEYFTSGLLGGLAPSLSFVVLFLVLLLMPKRRLTTKLTVRSRTSGAWRAPWQVQLAAGGALIVVLLFVPSFAGFHLTAWTQALADLLGFLALGLLVRTSGQVSLSHVAFLAIGACGLSHLAVDHGIPWGVAVVLSGLIAVPISAVLAIPAIRLSGLYLALATFGFGALLSYMFYTENFMFGSIGEALAEPRPQLSWLNLSSDTAFYYLVLVIVALGVGVTIAITRSRLGRLLQAMSDSPRGLETSGASITVGRITIFCIYGFMAAISGALGAAAQSSASGDTYAPLLSLTYLALIMITVGGVPWYAVQAAIGLDIIPSYFSSPDVANSLTVVFGIFAVTYVFSVSSMDDRRRRWQARLDPIFRKPKAADAAQRALSSLWTEPRVPETVLEIRDLRVVFGGLVAVDNVSLRASTGRITGLIGPNGAGKTTTFNACSGLNRPTRGVVEFGGRNISRFGAARRARHGIGRTYQQMELFDSLTVAENVRLGREGAMAGSNFLTNIFTRPAETRQISAAADRAMAACSVSDLASTPVASLSTGQRRLVELARCLAGDYRLLLLDEPSSGLDREETAKFGNILQTAVSELNIGVLLVEHDMDLVMSICDEVYVLDFGQLIFRGTPSEVQESPVVRKAYLGEDIEPAYPAVAEPARSREDAPGTVQLKREQGAQPVLAAVSRQPVAAPASAGPVLALRNVSGGYGETLVVRGVDLEVAPSSVVALLGPNGAGKTTLLRMASGLLRPSDGDVYLDSARATDTAAHHRAERGLCLIPEGRGIFRGLTVRENLQLAIPPRLQGKSVDAALDMFPVLRDRLRQTAGTMSGGQQQMLALARAFLAEPRVVLVDEVSMGLAPLVVDEIFTALEALRNTGVALLVVEQYVTRALELADRVYLLNRGSVVLSGDSSELGADAVMRGYLGGDPARQP